MLPEWKPLCKANISYLESDILDLVANASAPPPTQPVVAPAPTPAAATENSSKKSKAVVTASVSVESSPPVEAPTKSREGGVVPLPDYPLTWPEGKRTVGFSCSTSESVLVLRSLEPLLACSSTALVALFRPANCTVVKLCAETPSPVLIGYYPVNWLLATFCPGVSSIMAELQRMSRMRQFSESAVESLSNNAHILYSLLTSSQRMDSNLSVDKVESLRPYLTNPADTQNQPFEGAAATKRMSIGERRRVSINTVDSSQPSVSVSSLDAVGGGATSLRRSTLKQTNSGLTEKKLRALDSHFHPRLPSYEDRAQVKFLVNRVWDHIRDPAIALSKARDKSDLERAGDRAKRLTRKLQDLTLVC